MKAAGPTLCGAVLRQHLWRNSMLTEKIKELSNTYAAEMIRFRRELHRHPELSMAEYRTAQQIAEKLQTLDGMKVITKAAGGTGVIGILNGTKGRSKTVLLRADIDALPIEEKTGLPFSSENPGVMHACGHDGHAAWLLGSAMILSKLRDQFSGCVKFVFEPGEENGTGAAKMIEEDKVLEHPAVDAVFAAHAWPEAAAGEMLVAERCAFGYPGRFEIRVIGRGGHGSWPHECIDPIAVANQIYSGLQQIVSRRLPETAARVISVCTIHSGPQDKRNIIPDCCTMTGTIRADQIHVMEQMAEDIRQISQGIAAANEARAEVTVEYGKAVINTPDAVAFCIRSAARILGKEHVKLDTAPHLGGEDFSEYIHRVPGAYVFAGIATEKPEENFGLHSSCFRLEETVIPQMAAIFAQFAVDFLWKGGF